MTPYFGDLAEGRIASFAEIAKKEGKVERHIRLLAQLAFVSPTIVSIIAERKVSTLKVTNLAKAAAPAWAKQLQLGYAQQVVPATAPECYAT